MAVLWYAMRSKPNKEDFLARQFEAQGVQVYCPRIRVRVVNPRARKFRYYFPGYIFVQVDLDEISRSTLHWLSGAAGLVTIQAGPFAGREAIFDVRLSGDERVRVLLKLINKQQLPLDLRSGQIQAKTQSDGSFGKVP